MIPHLSERALIVAPVGRDAAIAAAILEEARFRTGVCNGLPDLVRELEAGAGFALLTEEALRTADVNALSAWIRAQPEWSDFPFVLLTQSGGGIERNPSASRFLDLLGNVTFLERPFHPTTLQSLATSAVRGRRRQYEARARLQELRLGAERYRSLFDSIDAGFCIIEIIFDESGRAKDYVVREANPAFERQTGLGDAVDRSILSMIPDHEHYWFEIYGEVARTGKSVRFENHAKALGNIWYEVYAFRAGEPSQNRVAVLFNDVSERRRMESSLRESEDTLRRLNESLEERVIERSHALHEAEEALRQAQKLESLGQLTGGVAHDFNNLLMAVSSSLVLLQKRIHDDPASDRLIENALRGTQRGAALTQRMLAFARRQNLAPEAIDLASLVNGMTDLAQRSLGPAWELEFDLPEDLPSIVADANQLEMALLNLLVNARDAMPDGGVIQIAAQTRSFASAAPHGLEAGDYIALSVIDEGHGMDAETLRRAAEPFFTTKGVGKGTGLGLPMIHGLARQLNGTLHLESKVGRGTMATLWLPAADDRHDPKGREVSEPDIARLDKRLHILAVDDDALILMNTAALLEDLGHDVLEATSGSEAIQLLESHGDIDLLITDHAMPKMTGTQLVQRARELRPNLPIILASGYADLPEGFHEPVIKLDKPFGQPALESAVANALALLPARQPV